MKKKYPISLLLLLATFYLSFGQVTIYSEDFTGQNGTGSIGPIPTTDLAGVNWSVDISGATLTDENDWFRVRANFFEGRDLDGSAIWLSPLIDISTFTAVQFSLDALQNGGALEASDNIVTEYSIDGGTTWIQAINNGFINDDHPDTVVSDTNLSGNTIQLRVIMTNTGGNAERHRFDNVLIEGTPLPDPCSELFISEYVEGSTATFLIFSVDWNKFIEIYNPTDTAIPLNNYDLQIYENGSATVSSTIPLTGTIAPYDVFVIGYSLALAPVTTDQDSFDLDFNGNDTVVLRNNTNIIDAVGQRGTNPGVEWTGTTCTEGTSNGTLVRNSTVLLGDIDETNAFDPDTEWTCIGTDNFSNLGSHVSDCPKNEIQLQYQIGYDVACGILVNYGTQIVGSDTDRIVRVENTGVADLEVTNLTFGTGANFSLISAPALPFTIVGGGFQDITIRFSPDAVGLFNDTLTITNNDSDEGLCALLLQGEGLLCDDATIWDGTNWSNGTPTASTIAIINAPYDTSISGSFTACSLEVNANLLVANTNFVEIINDVTVNGGNLVTETRGSFVQRGNGALAGSFTLNGGNSEVIKTTAILNTNVDYTYWGSPVFEPTVANGLGEANPGRRFTFNANNFVDEFGNGIDDAAPFAWTLVTDTDIMSPGQGFASTHGLFVQPLGTVGYDYIFEGVYNTGNITYPVIYNNLNVLFHYNLLGNPYPSAIDADEFFAANTGVFDPVIYMWSQSRPPDAANPGNEVLNFSQNDYVTINTISTAGVVTVEETGNGTGFTPAPLRQVPSGQGFFISTSAFNNSGPSGIVTFTNRMRVSGDNANDAFYRTSATNVTKRDDNSESIEKLWLNLSSDIGIYSQISVGYADFATDDYDGNGVDTWRNYAGTAGALYSLDNQGNGFYVIQGKAKSSLNLDEVLKIGFGAYISTRETYTLDLVQIEGDFLESNTIYLRDNYEGIVHDLSASAYTFESDGGSFDDRFEIVFTNNILSVDDLVTEANGLAIVELTDGNVQFTIKNRSLTIDSVNIYDIQGRLVYNLEGDASTEVYNLSNLQTSVYIAKVTLSNGQTITKKSIKK